MKVVNITNTKLLEESGLVPGDPVHIGVVGPGQFTNDAEFVSRIVDSENRVTGVTLSIRGKNNRFPWEDLIEFWPLPPVLCHSEPRKDSRVSRFREKLYGDS